MRKTLKKPKKSNQFYFRTELGVILKLIVGRENSNHLNGMMSHLSSNNLHKNRTRRRKTESSDIEKPVKINAKVLNRRWT